MKIAEFHPLVSRWFSETFGEPTAAQAEGWARIAEGRHALIAAPTGSGKTLAAFLWAINQLVEAAAEGRLTDETSIVYVSPLKALGNDIQKNLQNPLTEFRRLAERSAEEFPEIRVAVRSGDTPARERELMVRRPPHILITTPESLYILLTAERSRRFMRTARTVIVDEVHAVAGDKRGSHLAISLERLDALTGTECQRIGLSATQKPIAEIARLLVGNERECEIVDIGHQREWDLSIEVPGQPLGPIATHEMWAETYDRIAELALEHRTTLVFVNTRRLVERVAHQMGARLGEEKVAAHHGSLSRQIRLRAEAGLKSGEVPLVIATASLELGIDIGDVDLVVHLGAPRSLANLLQRIGRSGHSPASAEATAGSLSRPSIPKGIIFPLTRDELVQSAAAVRAAGRGDLDRVIMPGRPLDILAQQAVAIAAGEAISEDDLFALVRRAHPYRGLSQTEFEQVLEMLSEGVATRKGRRSAHLHRDRINGVVRGRRGARLAAITSGGAIPDTADYDVVEEPEGTFVGRVNEDFAIESAAGDIFLLGNTSWRIRRIEAGRVRVENAHGAPPTIPFWLGEAPARTRELSGAVSEVRESVAARIHDREAAVFWLLDGCGLDRAGAEQIVDYLAETLAVLGRTPTTSRVIAERFFDEAGGMQLVMHTPFGARVNRAWGLALRKRFCVTFDFELQAAATDDGVVISLGEQHSFPLESVFSYLRSPTLKDTLTQALLDSPMFTNRWRWNATRSLALLRFSGGGKVPMPILRMRAEDLLAAVFPEQLQCQEHRHGPVTPPDHPLVNETIANCLSEAMDFEGLKQIVEAIESGEIETVAVETPVPSPMSHEILNSNPYAFLDDAPLEERRARAVALRRTDPDLAEGIGALDEAAIAEVRAQAWPDVRSSDELHDLLLTIGILPVEEAAGWEDFWKELEDQGRVAAAVWGDESGETRTALVAAERTPLVRSALEEVSFEPEIRLPDSLATAPPAGEAARSIVHGWMQTAGPVTVAGLARRVGIDISAVEEAMVALESLGVVLRGRFSADRGDIEWCERGLLARIHRMTVERLRSEIEPVTASDFMRFLFRWQHLQPGTQLHGRDGVAEVISQLQGLELPAPAWEERILPARVARYDPAELEYLCLSGMVAWGRLFPESKNGPENGRRRSSMGRNAPIALVLREDLPWFARASVAPETSREGLSAAAGEVAAYLESRGASFMSDIVTVTRRMPAEVEGALWELVSRGLVSGDGIAGLRMLLRTGRRAPRPTRLRALPGARATRRPLPVGRWALWGTEVEPASEEERHEAFARQLLVRYGVVLRDLLAREKGAPAWRVLLPIYRRWEAQGEIRGGRFVAGFVGEQFALPEAVESLRALRKAPTDDEDLIVAASDPLNLVGILLPGEKISPFSSLAVSFRNGAVGDIAPIGTLRSRLFNRAGAS